MTTLFETDAGVLTDAGVKQCLNVFGVGRGATVMVHSRLFTVGKPCAGAVDGLVGTLLDTIGPEGTLIAPTFTLSYCKTGAFDADRSKSEMGILSERIRLHPSAKRTDNPVHSVAVIGRDQSRYLRASPDTSYGTGSIFDLLHEAGDVTFLTIGITNPCDAITYVHYVEQLAAVPYRTIKRFTGTVRSGGSARSQAIDCFVRHPINEVSFNGARCFEVTRRTGIYREAAFGNSVAYAVSEQSYYNVLKAEMAADRHFLATYHPAASERPKMTAISIVRSQ